MNVEIGAEARLFPEKEYISGIFVAVQTPGGVRIEGEGRVIIMMMKGRGYNWLVTS
jgi:hypothetical protein